MPKQIRPDGLRYLPLKEAIPVEIWIVRSRLHLILLADQDGQGSRQYTGHHPDNSGKVAINPANGL